MYIHNPIINEFLDLYNDHFNLKNVLKIAEFMKRPIPSTFSVIILY